MDCSMALASCCTLSDSSSWSISPSTAARFGSSPAICASLIRFSMVHVLVPAFQFDTCCCLSPSISASFACVPAIAAAFSIVKINVMVSSKMVR